MVYGFLVDVLSTFYPLNSTLCCAIWDRVEVYKGLMLIFWFLTDKLESFGFSKKAEMVVPLWVSCLILSLVGMFFRVKTI